MLLTLIVVLLLCVTAARAYAVLPQPKTSVRRLRDKNSKCSVAVFLGSGMFLERIPARQAPEAFIGGHTAEALLLLSSLDFERYTPRTYIISHGDTLSAQKALDLERSRAGPDSVRRSMLYPLVGQRLFRI